jgi:acetyl-CoA C-acetyltransferase
MSRKVAVVGVGCTKLGEHWDKSLRTLSTEAGALALMDAGIDGNEIEALFIGNMSAGRFVGQEHLAALAAEQAGLIPIPATRCEAACASGALAFAKACQSIRAGEHDIVVAAGAEKMTDLKGTDAISTLMGAGDQEWESSIGLTFAGLYALMARAYMHRYGMTRDELALVPVKNHLHGMKNPYAQFHMEVSVDQVKKSSLIADPLRLLDCSPITDGAAAIILASEKAAKRFENPVWVHGVGQASDTLALHNRADIVYTAAAEHAAKMALQKASITIDKINMAEVHDCFSIAEVLAYEALGFAGKGKAKDLLNSKDTTIGGRIPVNTDGGLKMGHPVGASGIKQIIEVARQIRGIAGNQVKDCNYGLTHSVGGSGATCIVSVLGKEEPKD